MSTYEARRLENIKRNAELVQGLGLNDVKPKVQSPRRPYVKRRKLETGQPVRTSARLARAPSRPNYHEDLDSESSAPTDRAKRKDSGLRRSAAQAMTPGPLRASISDSEVESGSRGAKPNIEKIRAGWICWTPTAPLPTQDAEGTYHFESHLDFTPNKSPEDIIREGCFGGSYWRPLYSKHLRTTIKEDWKELPTQWLTGLNIEQYLTSPEYNPEINKNGVSCGQSIEEWEANGWIAHDYDVRGWFQWYCRFWMGRRCDDDARQISRWKKCVGPTGRWRRTLLKQYVQKGIRSVFDDEDGDGSEGKGEVSPVISQTCLHWAYEVRQEALDRYWSDGM